MFKIAILFATLSINHPEELAILRAWHANYGDAERIAKRYNLSMELCFEYRRNLEKLCEIKNERPVWYAKCVNDIENTYVVQRCLVEIMLPDSEIYDYECGCSRPVEFDDVISNMKIIRGIIGDHMYYSGCLPDIFPAGYPIIPSVPVPEYK